MHPHRQKGFSLLELSIVLIITGVIAGSSLLLGVSQLENARRKATDRKLDAIETALMAFRTVNGRLPCPASYTLGASSASFGVQMSDPGTCTSAPFGPSNEVVEGAVPVRTIGLPDDFIYDGWGRKFAYAVDRTMTSTNVFPNYPTNQACGHITINDESGTARSTGAIYTLFSFGPTGHGAYIQTSTRNSTGATNANELQNCHCNNLAVATAYSSTYVQRDTLESTTAGNNFDDILRYKERWQMASIDDNISANDTYYGPELLVGAVSADYLYAYRVFCDAVTSMSSLSALPSGGAYGLAFTPDNVYLAAANGGVSPFLHLYKRTGLALNLLAGQPDTPPSAAARTAAFSNNTSYLAVGTGATPYLYIYRRRDDEFTKLDNPDTLPGATVNGVAFEPTSIHLAVAQAKSSSIVLRIYRYDNQNYSYVVGRPASQPAGNNAYGPSYSYNSVYLAVGSDAAPYLTLYKHYINDYTKIANEPATPPTSTVYHTAWSPDARYLAAAVADTPYVVIYKRSTATAAADSSFTKLSDPASLPPAAATGVSFSRGGVYLAVSHATSPFVTIYKRTGDSFTKISDPDVLPSSNGLSVRFRAP